MRRPRTSALFPYTTLFRSRAVELNDVLQYLGQLAFRPPVPAYKHSAAQFLALRGLIATDRTHPLSPRRPDSDRRGRSEEHTSELQSLTNLVCRLLLEKKKN